MYESHRQRLLPRRKFVLRVLSHFALAVAAIAVSLGVGMVGYHVLGDEPWIDALLNASMILGGMGPVNPLDAASAKLFASAYALYSGLFFIGILGVILAPFVHRLLHALHVDDKPSS